MKNSDVIQKILEYHPQFPVDYAGCDGYKIGNPDAECKGIATALVPTVDVIRRTAELGCNLLVVHEPIFYSTEDYSDWRAGGTNSVYEEKKALLEKYGITVWRDHDHMHAHNPDSIFTGVMKYLGWEKYYVTSEKSNIRVPMGYLFELPETTVEELGRYLEEKLDMNGMRIVGNPTDKIRRIAIVGHLFPGFGAQTETTEYGTDIINAMERGLDAIIPGEIIEWTVVSYVRDALALGRNKAIFNIGHFNMEELGMRYAQDWIGELVNHELQVHYLPMKLQQWAQDWFAVWQALHTDPYRTAQSYQGLLKNTILPRLGKYELAELTPARLKRFFGGLPGGKAKNTYKLLRTILQQAVQAGVLAENPCTPEILSEEVLAKRKAGPHREQPVFTRVEQEKLLAVCEEELWGNLIRFAFATGLPQGELLALREQDVDLAANRLSVCNRIARIAGEQTEGRKTRLALLPVQPYSVPLPAACKRIVELQLRTLRTLQAVDARCNPDHLLFATPDGRPIEANILREHLALLERRSGVPGLTFSAIRETAIRQALEDGGTDAEVMERFHCKDRQAFLRRYRQK